MRPCSRRLCGLDPAATCRRSGEVEAIGVHHLGPRRHEVLRELLLRVRARIDFRESAKLGVRTEDQVDRGRRSTWPHSSCDRGPRTRRLPPAATTVSMVSRLRKKSFVSFPGCLVRTPCLAPAAFAPRTRSPPMSAVISGPVSRSSCARSINASTGRHELLALAADIVAEAVGPRFERREGLHVGLILRRIHAARREGDLHVDAGILCGLFDRSGAAENDQVGERDLLAEALLDLLRASPAPS